MRLHSALRASFLCLLPFLAHGQQVSAPAPQPSAIIGTVTDVQGDILPGATVILSGPIQADTKTATADENGFFAFHDLQSEVTYHIRIRISGFVDYASSPLTLKPGQQIDLGDVKLTLAVVQTTVAAVSDEQIATQEVKVAEQQRVLGIVPNFYVVYNEHPVPLTTKLKYKLAFRTSIDVVSFGGAAFLAAANQAADTPSYQQGWKGYGQRFGAAYADGFSDIMIGGAILPSLLHQDPRYFYQGTGTTRSRILHAISSPFICHGDNGHLQFNFSSIGGDLASGALSNTYYPNRDRGPGLVFDSALITTGGRIANALAQEFLFRRFTTHSKNQN